MFEKKGFYNAAIYLRLSREDGDKVESDSISNQRDLCNDYIKSHTDLKLKKEYVDDGYTGTNFDRPGFKELQDDLNSGKINCVIVKDLSRFGRNYIETGRYIERIFPMLGIRFIAINDHYDSMKDSSDADSIIIPFKNLINDAYCRDISLKVRSQLEIKRKNGKCTSGHVTYGYIKDPKDKNHLIIDEGVADYIRLIFNMKINGSSPAKIAEKLNEMGVSSPLQRKVELGVDWNTGFKPKGKPKWSAVNVTRVLKNEVYTGTLVQGKYQKINYKIDKFRKLDESEWVKVEGTHDAIISKETFEAVQRLMVKDLRISPNMDTTYPLSGFIRCGTCGSNMIRRVVKKPYGTYYYYQCSTYKVKGTCAAHLINEIPIRDAVIDTLKRQSEILLDAEKIIKAADSLPQEHFGVKALDVQIEKLSVDIEKFKELKTRLYRDMVEGVIDKDEYREIDNQFAINIQKAIESRDELSSKRESTISQNPFESEWLQAFKKCRNISTLDRRIVVTLIDHIVVHDKKHCTIVFRYKDEMAEFIKTAESVKNLDKEVKDSEVC